MFQKLVRVGALLTLFLPAHAIAKGLVLMTSGMIEPAVEAFSETAVGDEYALSGDAEIELLHYRACVEVRFRGGKVRVTRDGLETTGTKLSEKSVNCPRKVAFKESVGGVAAVVLRDIAPGTKIGLRPEFALLNKNVRLVEITQDNVVVGRIGVEGGIAQWPASSPPLIHGGRYRVSLLEANRRLTAAVLAQSDAGLTIVQP